MKGDYEAHYGRFAAMEARLRKIVLDPPDLDMTELSVLSQRALRIAETARTLSGVLQMKADVAR